MPASNGARFGRVSERGFDRRSGPAAAVVIARGSAGCRNSYEDASTSKNPRSASSNDRDRDVQVSRPDPYATMVRHGSPSRQCALLVASLGVLQQYLRHRQPELVAPRDLRRRKSTEPSPQSRQTHQANLGFHFAGGHFHREDFRRPANTRASSCAGAQQHAALALELEQRESVPRPDIDEAAAQPRARDLRGSRDPVDPDHELPRRGMAPGRSRRIPARNASSRARSPSSPIQHERDLRRAPCVAHRGRQIDPVIAGIAEAATMGRAGPAPAASSASVATHRGHWNPAASRQRFMRSRSGGLGSTTITAGDRRHRRVGHLAAQRVMCSHSFWRAGVSGPISSSPMPTWRPSARAAFGVRRWATPRVERDTF